MKLKRKSTISRAAVKRAVPYVLKGMLFLFISLEFIFHVLDIGGFPIVKFQTERPFDLPFIDDPYAGVRMKPNECYISKAGGFRLENERSIQCLNSLGFRGGELDKRAVYKILCLGDSTTFGRGIFSNELIFSRMLEKRLSFHLQPKYLRKAVVVFNAGVPSHSVYQGLQLYWNYLMGLTHWDYVIISYGWNSGHLTAGHNLKNIQQNLPVNRPVYYARKILREIRTYNLLQNAFQKITNSEITADNVFETVYARLIHLVQGQGAKVVVWPMIIPRNSPAAKSESMKKFFRSRQKLNETVREIALTHGAAYLDMEPVFDRYKERMEWTDPVHFGPQGHALLSDAMFDYLIKDIE